MDEDPLQRRIYSLTFLESLEMIFTQYKETFEVLLDYLKIGGVNVNFFQWIPSGIFYMQIFMYTAED